MPWLLKTIIATALGYVIVRILAALGLSIVTYYGIDMALDELIAQIDMYTQGMPDALVKILAKFGIFKAISVIISAMTAVAVVKSAKVGLGVK